MGLEDSERGKKIEWGKKIQSGVRRFRVCLKTFRVGLEEGYKDSEWGKKIQSGVRRFRTG